MIHLPRIYALADASFGDPVDLCRRLFDGGLRLIQIRAKAASSRELLSMARAVVAFAPPDARVIINDRADVALLANCAGVHLGQDDLPAADARRILGPGFVIGLSTHNAAQFAAAQSEPVDYTAIGPVFATSSKVNPDPVIGLDSLPAILRSRRLPVVAIGGITLSTAPAVLASGVDSVAVIRDLIAVPDIAARCREYRNTLG